MSQPAWRKSSFSSGAQEECVEVAPGPDGLILFRESDRPGEIVTTTIPRWAALIYSIKAGRFDTLIV
ncbi:DUF397 domain-containing protein [Actinacidiphila oryziradicis]|jgi:hypothetical protein|uniref:DUF397 domain-containing protein n=1 Tax=Actinacidiphila oryziradicis TaxID=2571141 RepID=A0A4U0S671_9ACTN|nr:DUF397 domain-containing protein [Actinacidiphila oryziradicis]TKA04590.1 DUF397 domain-containing protein [Actinacidiphila oryziradicis]